MDDQLNVPLEDVELLAEVELTTDLIIAASETDQALPQSVIDQLLGVARSAVPRARRPEAFPEAFPTQTRHSA